ncbi:MAG TPA: cytochrome c-type biogenesis protein CcmH [Acidimicrobiales bacterium]
MRRPRFGLWTVLGAVLVVALVLGSGILTSSPPTDAQRAAAVESVVRCPTCEDLSVAQSTAPTAVAVRAAVTQQIAEGRSDPQVEAYLVDRYGSSIVLDPPARGWSLLVWLLPLLGGGAAVAALVVVLVRRRRLSEQDGGGPGTGPGPELMPEVAAERRTFLARSLADADAEYLAGDLSDQDYLALRQRDLVRLAALEARMGRAAAAAVEPEPAMAHASVAVDERVPGVGVAAAHRAETGASAPGAEGRPRRRLRRSTWFLVVGCLCLTSALVLAVTTFASGRQPGQSATGTFAQTAAQQTEESLAQAATDENQGQVGEAAQLYQSVLHQHADNEVALAQLGWLEFETGHQGNSASLMADARAKLLRAVRLDPSDYAARLYLGTLLLQRDADATGAVAQYRQFLADRPPAALLAQAGPEIRSAFQQAGMPVPASVPGA